MDPGIGKIIELGSNLLKQRAEKKIDKRDYQRKVHLEDREYDHRVENEDRGFENQKKNDEQELYYKKLVDDRNFAHQEKNVDQSFMHQVKVDDRGFGHQKMVDDRNFAHQVKTEGQSFAHQAKIDGQSFRHQVIGDDRSFYHQKNVDDRGYAHQVQFDNRNFTHQAKIDDQSFRHQVIGDDRSFYHQKNVDDRGYTHQKQVDMRNFTQQAKIEDQSFIHQVKNDDRGFYHQKQVDDRGFSHQMKVDDRNFEQSQEKLKLDLKMKGLKMQTEELNADLDNDMDRMLTNAVKTSNHGDLMYLKKRANMLDKDAVDYAHHLAQKMDPDTLYLMEMIRKEKDAHEVQKSEYIEILYKEKTDLEINLTGAVSELKSLHQTLETCQIQMNKIQDDKTTLEKRLEETITEHKETMASADVLRKEKMNKIQDDKTTLEKRLEETIIEHKKTMASADILRKEKESVPHLLNLLMAHKPNVVYLDLMNQEIKLGRITILLDDKTYPRRAELFSALCSPSPGSPGPTWRGATFSYICHKGREGECVSCSQYQSSSGSTEDRVPPGTPALELPISPGPVCTKGQVIGWSDQGDAGFVIRTRSHPGTETEPVLGHIISGLEHLEAAIINYAGEDSDGEGWATFPVRISASGVIFSAH